MLKSLKFWNLRNLTINRVTVLDQLAVTSPSVFKYHELHPVIYIESQNIDLYIHT